MSDYPQETLYTCAECQRPVSISPVTGEIIRYCGHDEAVVIADISAHATAVGNLTAN